MTDLFGQVPFKCFESGLYAKSPERWNGILVIHSGLPLLFSDSYFNFHFNLGINRLNSQSNYPLPEPIVFPRLWTSDSSIAVSVIGKLWLLAFILTTFSIHRVPPSSKHMMNLISQVSRRVVAMISREYQGNVGSSFDHNDEFAMTWERLHVFLKVLE